MLSSRLQILLVVLKYSRLIIFAEVIGEHVSVHQCTPALAENVQTFLEELHLNPGHVVLLHLLHLVLHHRVQLRLKLQRLQVVHVSVAVEEVALEGGSAGLLVVTVALRLVLVIPVAVVPGATMGLPGSKAHPAEIGLAALVFADHVVAPSILLDGSSTLWALLGVRRDPVARLAVVVALLDPLLDEVAPDGVVPVLAAGEAEGVTTGALHRPRLHMLHLYCVAAVRTRTPTEQPVALDKAVGDEVLVLQLDPGVGDKSHHGLVVDDDLAAAGALDHLAGSLVHYLGGEVFGPAGRAIQVPTLEAPHHGFRQR